jgi:hypothetical protein
MRAEEDLLIAYKYCYPKNFLWRVLEDLLITYMNWFHGGYGGLIWYSLDV